MNTHVPTQSERSYQRRQLLLLDVEIHVGYCHLLDTHRGYCHLLGKILMW